MQAMTNHRLRADEDFPEVSIVMPCLNEADTLATCISTAERALSEHILPVKLSSRTSGSADGSQDIATNQNAQLVNMRQQGYGSA
jgi:glycosyltransferase involved in cell wall biosynthesis